MSRATLVALAMAQAFAAGVDIGRGDSDWAGPALLLVIAAVTGWFAATE